VGPKVPGKKWVKLRGYYDWVIMRLGYLSLFLDSGDLELFLDAEGMEEVAAEDEGVVWSVDGVDPTGGDEECIASAEGNAGTEWNLVPEERVALLAGENPLLVATQVAVCGWNQPEHLHTERK
jgi:hypothetical protein